MADDLKITVEGDDWGDAAKIDIEAVLHDAASHIGRLMRNPVSCRIRVIPAPLDKRYPMTHPRLNDTDPVVIQLAVRNKLWAKFAYQFSHEFCHLLSNRCWEYPVAIHPHGWFDESLCELASVFTLRRMGEQWKTHPPYPHWHDYADALTDYANERLARKEHQLPEGEALYSWLLFQESSLRTDRYQRDKNAIVAYALIPVFEDMPSGWNATRDMPISLSTFKDYLIEWYERVLPEDKSFVQRILKRLTSED